MTMNQNRISGLQVFSVVAIGLGVVLSLFSFLFAGYLMIVGMVLDTAADIVFSTSLDQEAQTVWGLTIFSVLLMSAASLAMSIGGILMVLRKTGGRIVSLIVVPIILLEALALSIICFYQLSIGALEFDMQSVKSYFIFAPVLLVVFCMWGMVTMLHPRAAEHFRKG